MASFYKRSLYVFIFKFGNPSDDIMDSSFEREYIPSWHLWSIFRVFLLSIYSVNKLPSRCLDTFIIYNRWSLSNWWWVTNPRISFVWFWVWFVMAWQRKWNSVNIVIGHLTSNIQLRGRIDSSLHWGRPLWWLDGVFWVNTSRVWA